MRTVQVPLYHVVDVIAVLHLLVTAVGPVLVLGVAVIAVVIGRALVGIGGGDRHGVGHGSSSQRLCQVLSAPRG
jgi:hypothetical protein